MTMKVKRYVWVLVHLFFLNVMCLQAQKVPAFPGAEGGGMYVTGGRGGVVYYVTNLSDDPNTIGSLRWAINKTGPRIIQFKISGVIELNSELRIRNGDLTIAGQTAPGEGICLKNHQLNIAADNVIVRYIRSRLGTDGRVENDAMEGRGQKNIVIDHCSMSWSIDECTSFYDNENVTVQWTVVSESLQNAGVHSKGAHSAGGILGGNNMSFHHNVYAHHYTRNPRFSGSRNTNTPSTENVDFRNNLIYNWIDNSGYGGEGGSYNLVGNYYKYGPGTKSGVRYKIFEPWGDDGSLAQPSGVYGHFFVNDNYVYGSASVTSDNWAGILPRYTNLNFSNKDPFKSETEFDLAPVTTHSPTVAFDRVLDYAGASLKRDVVDARIMNEVRNGTTTFGTNGLIDSIAQVGGYPTYVYERENVLADSDRDGIPNGWEVEHGLDPNDASDGRSLAKGKGGYTHLDVYLASLVDDITSNQVSDAVDPVSVVLFDVPENGSLVLTSNGLSLTSGSVLRKGAVCSIAAEPNSGYELVSLTVNGVECLEDPQFTVEGSGDVFVHATMTLSSSLPKAIEYALVLYPNPVVESLTLEGALDGARVEIYTVLGQPIIGFDLSGQRSVLDVSSLGQGVYFLRCSKDSDVRVLRFLKR